MATQWVLPFAAVNGFIAVGLGAFGAHGLKNKLSAHMMDVYHTAVQYHFVHTLVLLAVGILMQQMHKTSTLVVAAYAFAFGILLFSGSLYVLALTGIKMLGAITPIGGVGLLIGWAALAVALFKA
ncbi:Uncharacterised protein [BD1-7 clade bacterium]|uniref:DUF423 domain-containing protein n=1 Tax=BD1-7 clade bacterium TaxID=2029982 RepID=A0A5S9N3Q4_9GAMM|nr:Uncharacterised protein [BD1-7 clade bacterium]